MKAFLFLALFTATQAFAQDATRALEVGEKAVLDGRMLQVTRVLEDGSYDLVGKYNEQYKAVAREYLAVTSGCDMGLCVNDVVYNSGTGRQEVIAAITTHGFFYNKTEIGLNRKPTPPTALKKIQ